MTLSQEESALTIRALRDWAEQIARMESMLATHALGVPGLPAKVLQVNTEIHELRLRAVDLADKMERWAIVGQQAAPVSPVDDLLRRLNASAMAAESSVAMEDSPAPVETWAAGLMNAGHAPEEMTRVEALMQRCQQWPGPIGGEALAPLEAHDILAECYSTLGALVQERDRLVRGECICTKCGLRQGGVDQGGPEF